MHPTGNLIPTSAIPFVETEHGRLRRRQRGIDKKDLQSARKYGRRKPYYHQKGDPAEKYTYKGIVYIVNKRTNEEVTSYAQAIKLDSIPVTADMVLQHENATNRLQQNLDSWTSNTVLVVDTSGSMRTSDVWGAPSRLSAVWLSLALDFVACRLESGSACATDVVSIVALNKEANIIIREEPTTWVLYNKLVRIYAQQSVPPRGHGPFLPALEVAETLLTRNSNAACAMGLMVLSDGKPSDTRRGMSLDTVLSLIPQKVGKLAQQFGRRLSFTCIGMGDYKEFAMLKRMVDAASDYGTVAELRLPSMTSAALGDAFTSVATSITTTQTEMTDMETFKQRQVRSVLRESRKKASTHITHVSDEDFYIYGLKEVERTVYKEWVEGGRRRKSFLKTPLQHPDARFVAIGKGPFGEGAERFCFRFYELAADGRTIVGKPLVAKESRLVMDNDIADEHARRQFVRTFCSTQQLAGRFAEEFNVKLAECAGPKTPRVSFLDCSVYQLTDVNIGKLSVLVEEKLDHEKWHKWNANNGFVEGMEKAPTFSQERMREAVLNLSNVGAGLGLDMIEECDDDDEEEDESSNSDSVETKRKPKPVFTPSEVAQAFSHFSYRASGRKRLVCDLQGVFDEEWNMLCFSDPVIHYHDSGRSADDAYFLQRRNSGGGGVHGRTDRGKKGLAMFFETHDEKHCGQLCRFVLRGFLRSNSSSHFNNNNHRQYPPGTTTICEPAAPEPLSNRSSRETKQFKLPPRTRPVAYIRSKLYSN